jgi:hypothetical protein
MGEILSTLVVRPDHGAPETLHAQSGLGVCVEAFLGFREGRFLLDGKDVKAHVYAY